MQIGLPRIFKEGSEAKLSITVDYDNQARELWYSVPVEYSDWFSTDRCDGFVVGLLLQAMARNEDMILDGSVSSKLFHNLQNFYIPMMAQAFPNLHIINIRPKYVTDERTGGLSACTGFSGGVDSFATLLQHHINEPSKGHKITHLLFHNVGSHGHWSSESTDKLFEERYQRLTPAAAEMGIPFVMVNSNLSEIFESDFITMHAPLNASIPLVLQNKFQRYYYASAYKYADCTVKRIDDIARFDPFSFHLLSTEGLDCVSTGCQMSRVEKTKMLATYEPSYRYLNVCVDPAFEGLNCSVCFKCRRTILTLELLGVVDRYSDVFDLAKFGKIRARYIRSVLFYRRGSFEAEVAALYLEKSNGILSWMFRLRNFLDKLCFG